VPKETKLSEDSNTADHNHVIADVVGHSETAKLSQSTTDTSRTPQTSEKAKKKKTKSKKRSEKIEISDASAGDGISAGEFDLTASQYAVGAADESSCGGVARRSKKTRHEGQVVRSEDVDGYCGSLPVDDLIVYIDCGRKLQRSRSQPYSGSLTEVENMRSVKKESAKDAAVENDSGFGDVEITDRTDASHSDGALSPSVSSISESVEIGVELLTDSLNAAVDQSTATREENSIAAVGELPDNTTVQWTVDSELSFAAAFLSDEELAPLEPEFTVVRQKKRRTKSQKTMPARDAVSVERTGCHLVEPLPSHSSSLVCSSASSERSNSPQSVATVNELTINGRVGRQMSDPQGRFISEPKWRGRHPRFHPLPYTSKELRPVQTQTHGSGNPSSRRWTTSNRSKYVPFAASSQLRELEKTKNRKYDSSVGVPRGSQLPDVVLTAERPRQVDKLCMSSAAKVTMHDAHCQTVDDAASQSLDLDSSVDTKHSHAPFDLLTLQLFMYHG